MVGSGRIFPAVSVSPDPSAVVPVMNLACFVFPPKTSCSESLFVRAGSCVRFLWNFSFFQSLNENIFEHDDTLMVTSTLSDGTDEVVTVTVQQIWGQAGLNVINFLGFFANDDDAQKAIEAADYVTFEEA